MKMLELFCGTKSVSNAFKSRGHEVYTVDWDKQFNPTLCADIGTISADDIIHLCGGIPDVVWLSPDCTTYSIAAISKHRRKDVDGNLKAKSEYAGFCDKVNAHIINVVVNQLKPRYWFIENPRAGFRKMNFVKPLKRYTVTYCQYGENRMKPTDIFTNHPCPQFAPTCKNGDKCHEAAPRGSRTGTQGIKGAIEKARIPKLLCEHIANICEKGL